MNVEDLKRELQSLPTTELKELRNWIGARLQFHSGGTTPTSARRSQSEDDDYLLAGFGYELSRRGLLSGTPRIPPRMLPPDYANKSAEVRAYLEKYLPDLRAADKVALGRVAAYTLAELLERQSIPVSPLTLLRRVGSVPTALNDAFPGYLISGVLVMVWRRQKVTA